MRASNEINCSKPHSIFISLNFRTAPLASTINYINS
jgi:hypothetical protein